MVLDVLTDGVLIQAYRGREVANAPDAFVEIHLLDELEPFLQVGARVGFECLDGRRYGDTRGDLDLHVEVVIVEIHRFYTKCGVLVNRIVKASQELGLYVWLEKLPTVFRTPHYVILMLVRAMVQALNSHGNSIARTTARYARGTIHPRTRG